jgi:hypothetical protein
MDDRGNLISTEGKTPKELEELAQRGFRPVCDEHAAQAGMILKGDKTGRVDPSVFNSWTGKKRNQHLKRRLKELNQQGRR